MKLADVTRQLQLLLPKYTDLVGDVLDISSIVATDTTATITTTTIHKLSDGEAVVLSGVGANTAIDSVSQDGLIFTFTTVTDHDITFGSPNHINASLQGFTDTDWNDSFKITSVPNRRTFKVQSDNVIPTLNGNETLEEVRSDGVNGRFKVTVTSQSVFTIEGTFLASNYTGGRVSSKVRIAGSATFNRAFNQYTKQNITDLWMFVVMGDAQVSKDRNTMNDSNASIPTGTEMRQRVMDGFELFIFQNVTTDMAATDAIDNARHDLQLPIMKSVQGAYFDSGLSGASDFRTAFVTHGLTDYTKSVLVYVYQFQTLYDLTDGDTVEPLDTRAYRDTSYTHEIGGDDTTDMTGIVNHDSDPL